MEAETPDQKCCCHAVSHGCTWSEDCPIKALKAELEREKEQHDKVTLAYVADETKSRALVAETAVRMQRIMTERDSYKKRLDDLADIMNEHATCYTAVEVMAALRRHYEIADCSTCKGTGFDPDSDPALMGKCPTCGDEERKS